MQENNQSNLTIEPLEGPTKSFNKIFFVDPECEIGESHIILLCQKGAIQSEIIVHDEFGDYKAMIKLNTNTADDLLSSAEKVTRIIDNLLELAEVLKSEAAIKIQAANISNNEQDTRE